jgi:hypothetical protein
VPPDPPTGPRDLAVDVDGLAAWATGLSALAATIATGIAQFPPLVVAAPQWATADALAELERAADRRFAALGDAIRQTARHVAETARAYEAADARAASRLPAVR